MDCFRYFPPDVFGRGGCFRDIPKRIRDAKGAHRRLHGFRATAIAGELQTVYDENKDASGDGVEAAQKAVSDAMSAARAVQADVEALVNAVETAKSFYAKVEDGTYVLSTAGRKLWLRYC